MNEETVRELASEDTSKRPDVWTLDHLVTRRDIAVLRGATLASVNAWVLKYADFPRPILGGGEGQRGAWYWWPDVKRFCDKNHLPGWRRIPIEYSGGK